MSLPSGLWVLMLVLNGGVGLTHLSSVVLLDHLEFGF